MVEKEVSDIGTEEETINKKQKDSKDANQG